MSNKVLVTLVDKDHLVYAKQLFSSAYFNAGWDGDFMILAHDIKDQDLQWFKDKGIFIKHCKPLKNYHKDRPGWLHIFIAKIYVFQQDMKKWDKVLYIDVDCIVRASLNRLTKVKTIAGVPFYHGKYHRFYKSKKIKSKNLFTTGVFSFDTAVINADTFNKMSDIAQELHKMFPKGVDLISHEELTIAEYFNYDFEKLPTVYNSVPLIFLKKFYIKPENIKGIIIHFASYNLDNKPWLKHNYFYPEWKKNFDKADEIDLNKIVSSKSTWSFFQILFHEVWVIILQVKSQKIIKLSTLIDRMIGTVGIFIKKISPSAYFFLRKILFNKNVK